MARTRNRTKEKAKQKDERWIARGFLKSMGYRVSRIVSLAPPRPDVLAYVNDDGRATRVGIELTRYHEDDSSNGSADAALQEFWTHVQESIRRRLAQRCHLWHVMGRVNFRNEAVPQKVDARVLASELISFAAANPIAKDEYRTLCQFPPQFPVLQKIVKSVLLCGGGSNSRWLCNSMPEHSFSPNCVLERIKGKNAGKYDWRGCGERWLLIYAQGWPPSSLADFCHEMIEWEESGITAAAQRSGYDRVWLWERCGKWCKPLHPNGEIIQDQEQRRT